MSRDGLPTAATPPPKERLVTVGPRTSICFRVPSPEPTSTISQPATKSGMDGKLIETSQFFVALGPTSLNDQTLFVVETYRRFELKSGLNLHRERFVDVEHVSSVVGSKAHR